MSTTTKTRQIALAVDPLSEEANKTVDWAIENFFRPTDEINAIMVMVLDSDFEELDSPNLPPTDSFEDIKKEFTQGKTVAMDAIVKKISEAGFQVKMHIFKTNATQACNVMVDYLDTQNMDCLVMGSRNLSGWKRFFMGSFSEYIQSHVHCPVLIVK